MTSTRPAIRHRRAQPTRLRAVPASAADSMPRTPGSTWALALATLAVGTSGHAVTGLLPRMSADLHTSLASVGQLVTVFALTCALAGPVLAVATGRWERRTLLVAALLVAAAGNAAAALAPGFAVLAAARVVTALGAATATAVAVGLAAETTAPHRRARAMAVVLTGIATALLIGVPSANAAASLIGYHAVLALVAALCAVAAATVATVVPAVAAPPVLSLRERLAAAGQRRVLAVLGGGLLAWTSSFTVYPYLSAVAAHHAHGQGAPLTVLLAGYGVGAVTGNVLGGRAADRFGPRAPMVAGNAGVAAVLLLLAPVVNSPIAGVVATVLWGVASWVINPALNAWLVELSPHRSGLLLALAGSAIYLGMGLGGLVGGAVMIWTGVAALTPIAAAIAAVACALLAVTGPAAPGLREDALPSHRSPVPEGASLQWPLR
ncbi:MFS transporter (plasmid) [Lentzea sp. JNUCC 0626]|uniref:MFS transporter n=1 Tax=Lentzea sp. JNUCC 0626 TaxID=3367513 RepID=UPI00374820B8